MAKIDLTPGASQLFSQVFMPYTIERKICKCQAKKLYYYDTSQ